jgi:hypothetical protein
MAARVPRSYEEIERHTVLELDGSLRADPPRTETEVRLDRQMRDVISAALVDDGIDTLGFEVIRGRVILHGWVRDQQMSDRVERIIGAAAPEAVIDNRMHIGV